MLSRTSEMESKVKHKTSVEKKNQKKLKDLVLKDLASRLPYHNTTVKVKRDMSWFSETLNVFLWHDIMNGNLKVEDIKVVLKPMSALSDKEMTELVVSALGGDPAAGFDTNDWIRFFDSDIEFIFYRRSYKDVIKFYDYCYAHGLDVNGLIDKGVGEDITFI